MFVNVWFALKLLSIFVLAKEAVSLSVIKLPDSAPNVFHLASLDAVYVLYPELIVNCDAVNVFNDVNGTDDVK